jgi:hypothetical protein
MKSIIRQCSPQHRGVYYTKKEDVIASRFSDADGEKAQASKPSPKQSPMNFENQNRQSPSRRFVKFNRVLQKSLRDVYRI